jgi:hypothetical protein
MDKIVSMGARKGASLNTKSAQVPHANNIMERDKEQSHRLHEPTSIHSHTDPVTGKDVVDRVGGPFIIDGILTAYFETNETRHVYLTSPFNHPVLKLGNKPSVEDDRGG